MGGEMGGDRREEFELAFSLECNSYCTSTDTVIIIIPRSVGKQLFLCEWADY